MAKLAKSVSGAAETISVADAKNRLSELLGRVAYGGETVLITRHGKPMAMLVPPGTGVDGPGLGDVTGWLEDDHPFFEAMDDVEATRARHLPRVLQPRKRGTTSPR